MSGTGSFADIIAAVRDGWGLLALALLLIGLLAIQMTKGANPNIRVITFLVIFAGFLGSLFMAFVNGRDAAPREPAAQAANGALAPPNAEDIRADAESAEVYRQSVDDAYRNAATEMDSVAAQIAGEEPAPAASEPPKD
ncbi:MAG TPA: hypothetical protein VFS49_04620 [Croceibacterium sp.]|nr:hypothetical protein [Croceibacterium sp.]